MLTTKNWLIKNCSINCTNEIPIDKTINLSLSELYIPSNNLPYGIYELKLTVTMIEYPSLSSSSSVYVQIIPTGITANLIELGTSMIIGGYKQDLKLNPGNYSIDPDENQFNASVSLNKIISALLLNIFNKYRIGYINIIVEHIISIVFHISLLLILIYLMIHLIHHVY